MEKWAAESFVFSEWKGRGIHILKGTGNIVEELEEAQVCEFLADSKFCRITSGTEGVVYIFGLCCRLQCLPLDQ